MKNNLISNIKNKYNNIQVIESCMADLYGNGSINFTTLEKLSYVKIFDPELFSKYEQSILMEMGLFFKDIQCNRFEDIIFDLAKRSIYDSTKQNFTPIQADIIEKIKNNKYFSFSSPTSTGKSHVFRYLISQTENDVVIIVPSRALINEYFKTIKSMYKTDKSINVLTFVDKINIVNAKRNIFIITPERTRDLFALKDEFNIDYILFDEAQLSEDKSVRGLYYDSVIRRCDRTFVNAKFVFAYPFIDNPEVQYKRNKIEYKSASYGTYNYKNVGQIFYSFDEKSFYHFGIDKEIFGNKIECSYDPLNKVLESGGTALIYCSKRAIYTSSIFGRFEKYISKCKKITNKEALEIINKFRSAIGASEDGGEYNSQMVNYLKRGIVIHHGSLPLIARTILEEFTQKGYCSLCFATSTLDQGINMPFDLVWIDRFTKSKPLNIKNLIGRAGRSTIDNKFDFGQIVVSDTVKTSLRKIVTNDIALGDISELDINTDANDDYKEYKEAIKTDQFDEELNLTNKEVMRLQDEDVEKSIKYILDNLFDSKKQIKQLHIDNADNFYNILLGHFQNIYEHYLNRRLTNPEKYVLNTAIKIMFWKIKGRTFNQIVWYRYSYAANLKQQHMILNDKRISEEQKRTLLMKIPANYINECQIIPNKKIMAQSLTYKKMAYEVDYDRIMVDTYDYLDKLIGFRVGDVFYASFYKYGINKKDTLGTDMANYIRYGTNKEKEIWILRYGLEFEDFDWLYDQIQSINEQGIILKENAQLDEEQYDRIENFLIQ